jgi:hypothetical protein
MRGEEDERARLALLLITPTLLRRCHAPLWMGMVPTCTPGVVGTPRSEYSGPSAKSPIGRASGPGANPVHTIANQLNKRCRPKHNPCRHRRERSPCADSAKARPPTIAGTAARNFGLSSGLVSENGANSA